MTSTLVRNLAAAAVLAALTIAAVPALSQDMAALARDSVGLPEKPNDAAAQPWSLESNGQPVCQLAMTAEPVGGGLYRLDLPPACASALPWHVAGWKPVTDGAAFYDTQGQLLFDFNRWSPKLLIAPRPRGGGPQLQLRRVG